MQFLQQQQKMYSPCSRTVLHTNCTESAPAIWVVVYIHVCCFFSAHRFGFVSRISALPLRAPTLLELFSALPVTTEDQVCRRGGKDKTAAMKKEKKPGLEHARVKLCMRLMRLAAMSLMSWKRQQKRTTYVACQTTGN